MTEEVNTQEKDTKVTHYQNLNLRNNLISREKLLEYGVHFGHKTYLWNPEMRNFIHGEKKGIHIINLNKIIASLIFAYNAIEKISSKGGTFLFVGTNKYSKKTIKENAIRTNSFYVNERWLGGTLTNLKTIQKSVKKLLYLERLEKNNFSGYTKKEGLKLKKELDKLRKNLEGIKYMRRKPSAIIVTSIIDEIIVIKEAQKMDIPVFGIADTNANPRLVRFPIFANDDGNKSISLIITFLADAIASAKGEPKLVAGVETDQIKVLGISENLNYVKKNYSKNLNYKRDGRGFKDFSNSKIEKYANKTEVIKKDNENIGEKPKFIKNIEIQNSVNTKIKIEKPKVMVEEQIDKNSVIKSIYLNNEHIINLRNKINNLNKNIDSSKELISITSLKGVGPKLSAYLNSKDIYLIKDILNIFDNNHFDEILENFPNAKDTNKKIEKFTNLVNQAIFFIN